MILTIQDDLSLNIKKKNENAVILGSGPSVANLSERKLKGMDKWSLNNFFLHPFIIPDFHVIEIKDIFRNFVRKSIASKKDKLKKTIFIYEKGRKFENIISPSEFNTYTFVHEKRKSASLKLTNKFVSDCSSSLSLVLDFIARMDYDKIYFIGVDLYSTEYFWTLLNIPVPEQMQWNNKCKGRNKDDKHTTWRMASYIKEFGKANNQYYINLSKNSLLKDYLPTENL